MGNSNRKAVSPIVEVPQIDYEQTCICFKRACKSTKYVCVTRGKHDCICIVDKYVLSPGECKAKTHPCLCKKTNKPKECRSDKHDCTCILGFRGLEGELKPVDDTEFKLKPEMIFHDACKGSNHTCICYLGEDLCKASEHIKN